jgi:hypothetical protein
MPVHDVHARAIVWSALGIAATIASVVCAVFLLLHEWQVPPGADRARLGFDLVVPGPALQPAPQLDLDRYRAEKERQLHATGWVDAPKGIAHVPVDTAMEMLVQRARSPASGPEVKR